LWVIPGGFSCGPQLSGSVSCQVEHGMYLLGVLFVVCALGAVNVAAGGARTAQKAVPTGMFLTGTFKEGPQFQMNLRWGAAATSKASTKSTGVEGEYWYLDSTSSYTLELSGTVLPDGSFRITETEVRVPYTGRGGDDNARETGSLVEDLGAVLLSDRGDSHRVWVDIQSEVPRASLAHGCPPRSWGIVHGTLHEAALASGPRTRVRNGGQPTPRKS